MEQLEAVTESIEQVPCGVFLLTSTFENHRSGVLTRWVQRCSVKPHMITIALPKGLPVEPLIRDSRAFALCQIGADDILLRRKFAIIPDRNDDPFVTISTFNAPSGSPIVERAMSYLDCELVSHIEFDSEYRLYVGLVKHAALLNRATPAIYYGPNGLSA